MCLGVFLLGSNFFGTLWVSWTCMCSSFPRLGKFSFIIFSNNFSISCSSCSPSGTPAIQVLECLKIVPEVPKTLLIFLEFWFCHSVLVKCLFIPSVPNCWFESQFPSFHCWCPVFFFFISLFIAFNSSSILHPYTVISVSMLIPSVLNSESDRLAISSSFSSFFWSFDLFFHLGHISLSQYACYSVRDRAFVICQSRSTHFTVCSLYILFYFTLCSLHFFLYYAALLNHFCEHPDYQYFELCIR